jgi:hypothetical protein
VSRLSDARISHLAHLMINELRKDGLADFPHEARALAETKRVLMEFFGYQDRLDEIVRKKILSLSRSIPPGSREWDVLYRKYFHEEAKKHKP